MHRSGIRAKTFLAAALSLSLGLAAGACGSSESKDEDDKAKTDKDEAKDVAKDEAKDEAKDVPKDETGGGGASVDLKDLVVTDQAPFKAVYDPDAKVWRWENDDYMTSIVVRALSEKVENMDDLKKEAPMMMALGSAIDKVVKEGKGDNGWWSIVESGGSPTFVYIMKLGGLTFTCSASLKSDMGKAHTEDATKKACESIKTK